MSELREAPAGHDGPAQAPVRSRKMTEAEEMAYYEKRYQQRKRSGKPGIACNVANGVPMFLQDMAALALEEKPDLHSEASHSPQAQPQGGASRARRRVQKPRKQPEWDSDF